MSMNAHARGLPKHKGYFYLASPYAKWALGPEDANKEAQMLAARLMEIDVPVFSPIAHTHGIAAYIPPRDHAFWMNVDKPMVDAAYGLLIADLPGWPESRGVTMEIGWAKEQDKPIWIINPTTLELRELNRLVDVSRRA